MSWTDIARHPAGLVRAYVDGLHVVVELNGTVLWRTAALPLLYLRTACSPMGQVACIGVGQDDFSYVVTEGLTKPLTKALRLPQTFRGRVHGNYPVLIDFQGERWRAYTVNVGGRTYSIRTVDGESVWPVPFPDGTSQGFRDLTPEGRIIWGDEAHVRTVRTWKLHQPVQRGSYIVGQIDGSDDIMLVHEQEPRSVRAIPGRGYEPRLVLLGSRAAVAARTPRGPALEYVTLPLPVEQDEPDRPPPPPPEKKKMRMPDLVYHTYKAVAEKYPVLLKSRRETDRQELHRRCMQTIKAKLKGGTGELDPERWVLKSAHSNLVPTKDTPCFVPEGTPQHGKKIRMLGWDMVDGEDRTINRQGDHKHDITHYVIEIEPWDWLGEEPNRPDPDPTVPVVEQLKQQIAELKKDIAACEGRILTQHSIIDHLDERLGNLERNTPAGLSQDDVRRMIGRITASGRLSIFGVTRDVAITIHHNQEE